MSDPIIKVENLGKSYFIGHERQQGYTALRDVLANKAKGFAKGVKNTLSGKQLIDGTEIEEFWALKDVNFEIQQGEAVGIIGRNGAGKSTLLKVLSRITEPTKGKITLKGRVASLLEVGTGFHPELSGRENIYLNGAILGMGRAEIKKKFDEIVDFSGVEKFLDTPVKRYSSGMYVRLAFSVAAHLEPEILVVDEVLAVGDAEFQKKCLGKMDDVSKNEGRTVLFVSHNMGTILQLCKTSILLKQGTVEDFGKSASIVEKYYNSQKSATYTKSKSDAEMFLKEIFTCDDEGKPQVNFAHKENINVRIVIGINTFHESHNIGICLLKIDKSRVFTVNKDVMSLYKQGEKEIVVDFIIEGGLIAPMEYSFLIALNSKGGLTTYEWHEDICAIKVYDDGTNLSFAEGINYGCIILKDKWKKVS